MKSLPVRGKLFYASWGPAATHASVALLLVVLVIVGYASVLGLPFLSEDHNIVGRLHLAGGGTNWALVWQDFHGPLLDKKGLYRPLYALSFGVDHWLYGLQPLGYRFTNLTMHAVCSFFVYLLTLELTRGLRIPAVSRATAFTAGAVFALYPIHAEPINWLAARVDLLYAMFYLPALLLFLRWLRTEKRIYAVLSLALFVFCLLSKETAATLPGALLLCALYRRERLWKILASLLPFVVVLGVYLLLRAYFLSEVSRAVGVSLAERDFDVLVSLYGLSYQTTHMLFPLNLNLIPVPARGILGTGMSLGIILLAAAFVVAVYYLRGEARRLLLLLAGLYVLPLLPVIQALSPNPSLATSRWLYLPSAFVAILIAYAIWSVVASWRWRLLSTVGVCGVFLFMLLANNAIWRGAGELSERLLATDQKPEIPLNYNGVPLFIADAGWQKANSPPFEEPDRK